MARRVIHLTRRVVETTERTEKILVRYCSSAGLGARPCLLTGNTCASGELVEKWVPLNQTFVKQGQRFYRLAIGHGEWLDIPVVDDASMSSP